MTKNASALFHVAERLDEAPMELVNGGAADALQALGASAPEAESVANQCGVDLSTVNALWVKAGARLRDVPDTMDGVFAAAAEAASLLYAASWVLQADSVTTEGVRDLI